jgi:hypothetical protein
VKLGLISVRRRIVSLSFARNCLHLDGISLGACLGERPKRDLMLALRRNAQPEHEQRFSPRYRVYPIARA